MNQLLIFIGEDEKFDVEATIHAIMSLPGVSNAHQKDRFGALFECEYTFAGVNTIVRLSEDAETISAYGVDDTSLTFALELQRALPVDLRVIDMNYDFDVVLRGFNSVAELDQAIAKQSTLEELTPLRKDQLDG